MRLGQSRVERSADAWAKAWWCQVEPRGQSSAKAVGCIQACAHFDQVYSTGRVRPGSAPRPRKPSKVPVVPNVDAVGPRATLCSPWPIVEANRKRSVRRLRYKYPVPDCEFNEREFETAVNYELIAAWQPYLVASSLRDRRGAQRRRQCVLSPSASPLQP